MTTTTSSSGRITREDIRGKLADISDDATSTVTDAKSQIITAGAAIALLLLILAFVLGRRGGTRRSTIIEVKRA